MKKLLRKLFLSIALIALFSQTISIPIKAQTSLGYESSYSDLTIQVVGNGVVRFNTYTITNNKTMRCKTNDMITLHLQPNKGANLASLNYNGNLYYNNNLRSFTFMKTKEHTHIIVTFLDEEKLPIPPIIEPIEPSIPKPPPEKEEPPKKDLITSIVITKDIPFNDIKGEITDEFLRGYINSSQNYKILSHNVKKKAGTYDILIELENGERKNLKIKVLPADEQTMDKKQKRCYLWIIMLLVMLAYVCYMHHRVKKLKEEVKEGQR